MIATFFQQYITTVIAALTILSAAFFIFWKLLGNKLANRKIQLSKRAGWLQIKGEIGATMLSFIGSTVFMFIILSFKDKGVAKFYIDAGKFGWAYEVLVILIMVLVSDAWFYWSHRIMHHPKLYKYIHEAN